MIAGLWSFSKPADAKVVPGQYGFSYEVTKSNSEWKSQLGEHAFKILREGETEEEGSSPLASDKRSGHFNCAGCDLTIYKSLYRAYPDKGWIFFRMAEPNSVMTGIDGPEEALTDPNLVSLLTENPSLGELFSNEVHCRRCGSHFGHILLVENQVLHCINGTSLHLIPNAA